MRLRQWRADDLKARLTSQPGELLLDRTVRRNLGERREEPFHAG